MNFEMKFEMKVPMVLLGEGATGKVFAGTFENKEVAVKRIQLPDAIKVSREVTGMANLNHPNVLKLLAVDEDDTFKYIVLEYCIASVSDYCDGKYKGDVPPNPNALYQMADGLCYIHLYVAHRDISTGNVLISLNEGKPVMKIADFGFCKPASENGSFSLSQNIRGTEHFIARELLVMMQSNEDVRGTIKSDIFSLGCVFFKFLVKKGHPFEDELKSRYRIPINIMNNQYFLQRLDEDGHGYTRPIIEQMIQSDPEQRITLVHVMERLKPHLVGEN